MSAWRTFIAALFAAPAVPISHEIEEAIRRRGEVSRFTARVHRAAQTSALEIIEKQQPPVDTLDAWVKGNDTDAG